MSPFDGTYTFKTKFRKNKEIFGDLFKSLFWGTIFRCVTLLCHVAETSLVFDQLKEAGEAEPNESSNAQPELWCKIHSSSAKMWIHKPKKTLSDNFRSSTGESRACEVDEASENGASPKPAEFDKPLVQNVLRVCKIAARGCAGLVVADYADEEGAKDIYADAVGDVQSVDDLATHVNKHHDNHLEC